MNGGILCAECLRKRSPISAQVNEYEELREADILCPLSKAALAALQYCASAPLERLFSFELSDSEDLRLFLAATETYLLSHIGHGFRTLDFYRSMKEP